MINYNSINFINIKNMLINGKKFGNVLVEKKIINQSQLDEALLYQKTHKGLKLGDIIISLGFAEDIQVLKSVTLDYHIPMAIELLRKQGRDVSHLIHLSGSGILDNALMEETESSLEKFRYTFEIQKLLDEKLFSFDINEETLLNTLIVMIDQEKYQQAINYALDSISNFPNSKLIIYVLTWLYIKEGLITDAEVLNRQMNPNYMEQYHIIELLAFGRMANKEYKEAIVLYKALLKMDEVKQNSIWFFYFGYSFDLNNKNKVFAEKFYRHFLKHEENNQDLNTFIKERLASFRE